jgi:hypothetical protein
MSQRVVGGIGPKLTGLGATSAGIEYGRGGLIREQPGQFPEPHEEALMQRAQVPGGMADPVCQVDPIQIDAPRGRKSGPSDTAADGRHI